MTPMTAPAASVPSPSAPRRRLWLGAGAALLALLALGLAGFLYVRAELDPGAPVAGISNVVVRDNEFEPAAIEVPAGTTVTWTWAGAEDHNVVGGGFESPAQSAGTFAHTFATAGTHAYECTFHFFMRGEVVVTE